MQAHDKDKQEDEIGKQTREASTRETSRQADRPRGTRDGVARKNKRGGGGGIRYFCIHRLIGCSKKKNKEASPYTTYTT